MSDMNEAARIERLAVIMERERCAEVAADWFTLAPKHRTKRRLLAMIKSTKQEQRRRCSECGKYWADLPSDICPGCEAYREHMSGEGA